jgi:hypothetical protein
VHWRLLDDTPALLRDLDGSTLRVTEIDVVCATSLGNAHVDRALGSVEPGASTGESDHTAQLFPGRQLATVLVECVREVITEILTVDLDRLVVTIDHDFRAGLTSRRVEQIHRIEYACQVPRRALLLIAPPKGKEPELLIKKLVELSDTHTAALEFGSQSLEGRTILAPKQGE